MIKYLYILLTIFFTSYGQLILKWRLNSLNDIPNNITEKFIFLTKIIFTDPFIMSSFAAAYVASLFWMSALSKLQLNVVYPFMSLSFVAVFVCSIFLFHEKISWQQVIGLLLIIGGVILLGSTMKAVQ